jgi:hypothetical protein
LGCEHDAACAIALRQRGVEIDVPIYEPWAGAAAAAVFLVVAVVDFLGGMVADICSIVDVERYLMLQMKDCLLKSIERRMWWELWEYAGMASARLWRGFRAYIVARPKRVRLPDQQLASNRPFLFRKDLVLCVQFVISCKLMSLADWAKFGNGMVDLSGSSRVCCSLPHFVSRLPRL